MIKHFAAALGLILAGSAVAGADCFNRFCVQKVQKVQVQKVIVQKQVVAQPVYYAGYYHQPVGYQAQGHKTNDELTAAAIDRLADALAVRLGVNTQAVKASAAVNKCAKCHTGNGSGVDSFAIPDGPMDWRTAERVQFALVETDMGDLAKLTTDEFKQLLIETRVVLSEQFTAPPANALPLENEE